MDTLIEASLESVDWVTNRTGIILVLLATLPVVLFLRASWALRISALAVLIGAVTLVLLGTGGIAGAVIVVIANMLLISIAALSTRKRLTQMEAHLEAAMSTVRNLECVEQRRQAFAARNPIDNTSPPASMDGTQP